MRASASAHVALAPAMDDLEGPRWERPTRLLRRADASVSADQIAAPESSRATVCSSIADTLASTRNEKSTHRLMVRFFWR